MKYWGQIRILDLRNRTDAELEADARACEKGARQGLLKMTGGIGTTILAFMLPSAVPFLPLALMIATPVLFYTGYKAFRQNMDGIRAHENETLRRKLPIFKVTPAAAAAAPAPAPSAPVFNGVAAVTLSADVKPMKAIKLNVKAQSVDIAA